ncbi:MAG: sulfatase [Bacteroidota bacterium]
MKKLLTLLFCLGTMPLFAQKERPNIVFILVDDLGAMDVGFMGSPYYQTPHLDVLAKRSTLFTQAYAGAANCAPSRAVLMSGQYPTRHGIYTVGSSERGKPSTRRIIPTPNTRQLADSMLTLPEALKSVGYVNGHFGKWHLGEDPLTQGFDINVGGSTRGNPGKDGHWSPYNLAFIEDGPEGEYLADRLTEEAIKFIEAQQDTHFFMYLPFYTVHTPLLGKPDLVAKYDSLPANAGQGHQKHYAAMVENMDASVGRILRTLEQLDLDNTLIIFSSDNGGIASVSRQWPLRAGKGSYYEGGIRVPLLMSWPGHIPSGERLDFPLSFLDFYPSLLGLLEISLPEGKILDGLDLSAPIKGKKTKNELSTRPLIWHFPIYLEAYKVDLDDGRDPLFRTRPGSVIRMGDWKLHQYFEDGGLELYNLAQDPGERINLVEAHPAQTERLLLALHQWRQEFDAPVPSELNPAFEK